ncbi:MAG: DUF3267 domain-containing protein [Lachnospiraceae bacterium]|nr:DUF3267 domain-containing protein [Lachnospiraceae bacterium]
MSKEKNTDKTKTLTEAEKKRLERFNGISQDMEQQGYTRHDLTISIGKANLYAILFFIPLFIIGFGLEYLVNGHFGASGINLIFFLVAFVLLIVVHELIHGFFWSLYTPGRFKDIEFGVLRSSLTPYCTCLVPLKKNQYFVGTIMPFILLGVIPMIVGIAIDNINVLFLGIVMADSAMGDLMIIWRLLRYKSNSAEITYMDHPTEAGGVVFER